MKEKLNKALESKILSLFLGLVFVSSVGSYIYLEKEKKNIVLPKEEIKVENKVAPTTPNVTKPVTTNTEKQAPANDTSEVFIAQSGGHDSGNPVSKFIYSTSKIEKGKYEEIDKSCMSDDLYKKYTTELPGIMYSQYDYSETVKTVINDKKTLAQVLLNTKIATDKSMELSNKTELIDFTVEKINGSWIVTKESRRRLK